MLYLKDLVKTRTYKRNHSDKHHFEMFSLHKILSADIFQAMENLYVVNLGNNLIEDFSKTLITEWFTADGATELNLSLKLNDNPVSISYSDKIISYRMVHDMDYIIKSL